MQSQEKPVVQLAYLLPLTELLICWTLLFFANPDLPHQISASLHPPPTSRASETERLQAPISATRDWRANVTQVMWLTNAPGMWAELATSTRAWPDSWFPVGFPDLFAWRALLWPFAAMPFWFSAGRGIDWFINRTHSPCRIGKLSLLLALVSVAYGFLLALIGLIDDNPLFRSPMLDHALSIAGFLWLVLGAIACCAGFLQWRASRELRRAKKEAVSANQ